MAMRKRLLQLFTIVGAITTGILALVIFASIVRCASADEVPETTVLELRLDRPLAPGPVDPLAGLLGQKGTGLIDVISALERAGDDERIAGVLVHLADVDYGFANVQEIRDGITRIRAKGKWVIAHADSFGELGPGNQGYYLATACDEIWLQPTGGVGLTGLVSESMFVKGALDMVGVKPEGDHRKKYKNAFNMFTERRYTPEHREAAQTLIDDMFGQMVRGISERRGIDEAKVRTLVDEGPFLAARAHEVGLVDGLAYRDEVVAKVKEKAGAGAKLLYVDPYLERAGRPWAEGDKAIALVYGIGGVSRGPSSFDPLSGESSMGSETVSAALSAAIEAEDVAAIVFRVDSPGGSAVASDAIWRETQRAKDAGKPVIITMGNLAASGGYYVSAGATKIVAHPATITGSIGVFAGKGVTRDAWNKVGVTWDMVQTSQNAAFFSTLDAYDPEGWARLQGWLDAVYVDFTGKVASGRGLSMEEVEAIAQGRVWTGERALQHGLVDEHGGLVRAIELAKEAAGIPADAKIELRTYPREEGFLAAFLGDGSESSDPSEAAARVEVGLERWRPVAAKLQALGELDADGRVLMMAPLDVGK
jgi:protease-4